jgi:hypothetical protein
MLFRNKLHAAKIRMIGLEPTIHGFKNRCLNRLGYTPKKKDLKKEREECCRRHAKKQRMQRMQRMQQMFRMLAAATATTDATPERKNACSIRAKNI